MTLLHIVVPGLPVAKERPRLGKHGVYTPKGTRTWEDSVVWLARSQVAARVPTYGPVSLVVEAVHARPKARPYHVGHDAWKAGGRCYAVTRKDLDNVIKCAGDALNGVGVWRDDNQVAHVEARSWYAAVGEGPSVTITVSELSDVVESVG